MHPQNPAPPTQSNPQQKSLYAVELAAEEASAIIQALNALNVTGNAVALVQWLGLVETTVAKLQPIADTMDEKAKPMLQPVPPKPKPVPVLNRKRSRPNKSMNSSSK